MNSGGAHCLKYGVTNEHLLGASLHGADGPAGGPSLAGGQSGCGGGPRLLGVVCGSKVQLGVFVTESTLRILRKPEARAPVLIGFYTTRGCGRFVWPEIIQKACCPLRLEFNGWALYRDTDKFAGAGYPRLRALPDRRGRRCACRIDTKLWQDHGDCPENMTPVECGEASLRRKSAAIWKGRNLRLGDWSRFSDYKCVLDGTTRSQSCRMVVENALARWPMITGCAWAMVFHGGRRQNIATRLNL